MKTGRSTNEELVLVYQETHDEKYLQELISVNTPLLSLIVKPYLATIPNSEYEDLISESYFPMLKAINDFDKNRGLEFTTLLKAYVSQHLNRIYNKDTRKKRYTGSTPVSYESLVDINKEGGTEVDGSFTVEVDDYNTSEFLLWIDSLGLNERERVVVTVLMCGGTKGEVAKALKCTPATANYYFKNLRKKFELAGMCV